MTGQTSPIVETSAENFGDVAKKKNPVLYVTKAAQEKMGAISITSYEIIRMNGHQDEQIEAIANKKEGYENCIVGYAIRDEDQTAIQKL